MLPNFYVSLTLSMQTLYHIIFRVNNIIEKEMCCW